MSVILGRAEMLELGMTNYDGSIDTGLAEALVQEQGVVCAQHSAWNFCGYVWYEDNAFHEEVWVHNVPREVISSSGLRELMATVNAKYGSD